MIAVARPAASARWRPSPLIAASIGLHAAALAGTFVSPDAWKWSLGAIAANHAVLTVLGLWPRSSALGPNITRLPPDATARSEVALTFDDGPDPLVTPKVMDLLEAHGARGTFFCIASRAEKHPDVVAEIARRGHGVENHSRDHSAFFPTLGIGGFRRELGAAQETLARCAGRAPRFFRPPAGLRNPLLDPALHATGLRLATWTRRGFDTRETDPARVAGRLLDGLAAGDILLLHDGSSATTPAGAPVVLEALPRLLEAIDARGLHAVTLAQAIDP